LEGIYLGYLNTELMGDMGNANKNLVGRSEVKRPLFGVMGRW
jgi:hypothetical protein